MWVPPVISVKPSPLLSPAVSPFSPTEHRAIITQRSADESDVMSQTHVVTSQLEARADYAVPGSVVQRLSLRYARVGRFLKVKHSESCSSRKKKRLAEHV